MHTDIELSDKCPICGGVVYEVDSDSIYHPSYDYMTEGELELIFLKEACRDCDYEKIKMK